MRLLRRTPQPACVEVVELVTAYLEGTMSRRLSRRLEAHLAGCPHCSEYLAQMRVTISLTGHLRERDLPPQIRPELRELFAAWSARGEPPAHGQV